MDFTKEQRAAIAHDFREEIQKYGIRAAIVNVLQSKSEKVAVRKVVIAQQCRKNSFRKEFEQACAELNASMPNVRCGLRMLRREVLDAQ